MPNVMAAQRNISDALCESSIIPFLVPRRKVWLTPAAGVPLHLSKFRQGVRAPKNVHIVHQSRRQPNIVQSLGGLR